MGYIKAIYNMPSHKSGNTFNGVEFYITINDEPLNLLGASIIGIFKMKHNRNIKYELSISNNKMSIIDSNGKCKINKQKIDWRIGEYDYEITFILSNNDIKTYIIGTWEIIL